MNQNKVTINKSQYRSLLICVMWPTVINYGSGLLAREVGSDMWISGLISIFNTLILGFILIAIGKKFPGKTIVEYSRDLIWLVPGKIVGIILTLFFLLAATNTVAMYIHHLTDFLLPETPFLVVTVLHIALLTYLAMKGPEVAARLGVFAFAVAVLFHFLVFLASLSELNFGRLLPLFESGVLTTYKAGFSVDTFIGATVLIIGMLLPLAVDQKKIYRTTASGIFIGGFFFIFYFIVELMVMGPQVVALMRIASMDFVRSIQITQYLHRFESFMVALWYWSMLVKAGILIYCSHKALTLTSGIKKPKTKSIFVYIYGGALIVLTYLLANNRVIFLTYREEIWPYISLPIQYGIPIIFLLAFALRKAFGSTDNSNNNGNSSNSGNSNDNAKNKNDSGSSPTAESNQ